MIQEFSVSNFRSIKEKQTISFVPNKRIANSSDEFLLVQVNENTSLLKFGVLYGYNASGKSNIIRAFSTLRYLVLNGSDKKSPIDEYDPFLLDDESSGKPSVFDLVFYVDGIKYSYHLEITNQAVEKEVLCGYPNGHKTTYFSRSFNADSGVSKVSFSRECGFSSPDKLIITGNTLNNITVLYAYQKTNVSFDVFDLVIGFFDGYVMPEITPSIDLLDWGTRKISSDRSNVSFYESILKKADFQISNVEVKEDTVPMTEEMMSFFSESGMPEDMQEKIREERTIRTRNLVFGHKTSSGKMFFLSDANESNGTQRYFGLGAVLKELIDNNHFICIDELETSLHPELVLFFITMFLMNSDNSQMFITTHVQQLMDADFMRADMLWFCEKNDNGCSEYYQLQDFGLHKNIRVVNYYRAGRLGAFPDLDSPLIRKEETLHNG